MNPALKTLFLPIAYGIAALSFCNCTSTKKYNEIGGATLAINMNFSNLKRKDFKVLTLAEGKSTVKYDRVLFWSSFDFGENTEKGFVKGFSSPSVSHGEALAYANDRALYNALEKIPNADAVLEPRFSWDCQYSNSFFAIRETCTVTVKGKAISINEG